MKSSLSGTVHSNKNHFLKRLSLGFPMNMIASSINQEMWRKANRAERTRHVAKVGVSVLLFALILLFGGSELEKYYMRQAADTLWAYDTHRVCGYQVLEFLVDENNDNLEESYDGNSSNNGNNNEIPESMPKTQKTDLAKAIKRTKEELRKIQLEHQDKNIVNGDSEASGPFSIFNKDSKWQDVFHTYESVAEAKEAGASVAHCGDCGHCSNIQDITIIEQTKHSLTKTTTGCAKLAIPFRRSIAEACMDKHVGFTEACRNCWVDNIICTLTRCGFTCAKSVFLYRQQGDHKGNKTLNECLECDEKMCGPNFIRCAGANRRRSGIISDIKRSDSEEVCQRVDEDWKEWLNVLHQVHSGHLYKYADKERERLLEEEQEREILQVEGKLEPRHSMPSEITTTSSEL